MTPIPPKIWTLVKGDFDLPPDEEFDAAQVHRLPPVDSAWPFPTVHYVDCHPDGREVEHYLYKTSENKWLEIITEN